MAFIGRTGSLLWRGDSGSSAWANQSRSDVGPAPDVGRFHTFSLAIRDYSECSLTHYYSLESYSRNPGAPGVGANIDRKGVIYYRDPSDWLVYNFQYPDPPVADIERTAWGKRIKDSSVISIVALLSTLSGVSYVPLYGVYYQRK